MDIAIEKINEVGFPKGPLIERFMAEKTPADMAMALEIASWSLFKQKTWDGKPYCLHYLKVADINNIDVSDDEKTVGLLHDVVEDTDWTIEDLEHIGFSIKICEGVRSVTKSKGDLYLDGTKRCSANPIGRRVKMRDNRDNMDLTRSLRTASPKQKYLYHISYSYLRAVEEGDITPEYPVWKFLQLPKFSGLLTEENFNLIAKSTLEPVPARLIQMYGEPQAQIPRPKVA
jgi:hypothetical protein